MAARRAAKTAKSQKVFGQREKPAKMFRAGLYANQTFDRDQANNAIDTSETTALRATRPITAVRPARSGIDLSSNSAISVMAT